MLRHLSLSTLVVLFSLLLFPACDDSNPWKPPEPGWYSIGLENHWALELELDWPYLYACAADEGLFRAQVNVSEVHWNYVGLADTTISPTPFGHWKNRGVQDVAVLDNGDILAGVVSYIDGVPGLFRSSDNGKSWKRSDAGWVDPSGEAWLGTYKLEVSPCEPTVVFACGDGAIYRSEDNGVNWQHLWGGGGLGMNDIQIHPEDCSLGWAGGMSVVFGTLAIRTVDGGQTWEYVAMQKVLGSENCVYRIAWNPDDSNEIFFGTIGGVIKTDDGAQNWSYLSFPVGWLGEFAALIVDDDDPAHLMAAAGSRMFESWDGGETLTILDNPIKRAATDMVYDSRRGTLYVGTLDGVLRYQTR